VNCSPILKWSVALLLVLTLGWKWAVYSSARPADDSSDVEEGHAVQKVAGFLVRNQFRVAGSREVTFGLQVLEVSAGPCRMLLAFGSSRGWHRDLIRGMTTATDRSFVVFGGKIYPEQPMWLTVPDFLWSRLMSGIGLSRPRTPVITVIADPSCEADRLPWRELG
jgi:hypothetical protein